MNGDQKEKKLKKIDIKDNAKMAEWTINELKELNERLENHLFKKDKIPGNESDRKDTHVI